MILNFFIYQIQQFKFIYIFNYLNKSRINKSVYVLTIIF